MQQMQPARLFKSMLRIRRIEEALADRYAEQEMRCPMHLCIGQEAIAVGVCAALHPTDRVFSNHRAHGHYLAKGGNLNAMLAELYGRATGCCGGRGGSMHLIDLDVGFMGSTPIVGGTVPLAVGSAWASSLKQSDQVTVVFFGDGCFEEGVVHESLNFAALHKLPVLFVCENNDFSVYTRRNERQPDRPIYRLAEAHGMAAFSGNGNDVEEVLNISSEAIDNARLGRGPQFIEFRTYRWREHCGPNFDDDLNYRSTQEIESGMGDCPIASHAAELTLKDASFSRDIEKYEDEIRQEIAAAFEFALSSKKPTSEDACGKVYA
ncbi:acetoin dehydrogenase [Sulfurimicrobium lacus]|uniref:Acetoin dehydrogenase n=1 Tax=Sulfurimicrobium lacus TaxID=2715678 RepID=A0A6F8VDX7_9PROT|nr:thiamine pyrophosphate-dependent dehydrogenase E1 component subunit alpha [Sulfurimicrobium lacus]BCB26939.1 acetoin dehydrogenase [Sulfurimicrobium lacus]